MYKKFIKPLFFSLSPESAHVITINFMKMIQFTGIYKMYQRYNEYRKDCGKEVMGLDFKNPVGLAAGFDKNGEVSNALGALGFGFIEIGTVTPVAQPGNKKPRIFRLPKDLALINRLGFNNIGVDKVAVNLKLYAKRDFILGANIGKNKLTPNNKAVEDYEKCFLALFDLVDYFVVNVSSPNTPGLRELQDKDELLQILGRLVLLNSEKRQPKPILLKIAPDLTTEQVDDTLFVVKSVGISGLVIANTTVSRTNLKTSDKILNDLDEGGLSGIPLRTRSNDLIHYVRSRVAKDFVIIGVGGIFSGADVVAKLAAGANLVQLYTGMIYEGPGIVHKILANLRLDTTKFNN